MPSRQDIAGVIDRLLDGTMSREEVSLWAGEFHMVEATDPVVEDALDVLTLIDGRHINLNGVPLGYLYDFEELTAVRRLLDEISGE